jgi:gliding motility-associated-like protein
MRLIQLIAFLNIILLPIALFAQPVASFTADRNSGCAGQFQVNFTNTSTGATSYLWDLGDGDFSNDVNPSKIYLFPGNKIIRLIAYNGSQSDTATAIIQSFRSPVIQFTLNKDTACVNTAVCTNQNITLGDAPLVSGIWDFGIIPVISTLNDTCFFYPNAGKYQITRIVVDANSCQATLVVPGAIVVRQPPVASFTLSQNNSCSAPLCVNFTNNSSHPAGLPVGYCWDFGDGSGPCSSTTPNPPQRCYSSGSYNVVLRANDSKGCFSIDSSRINVTRVTANFTLSTNNLCRGDTLILTNTSTVLGGTPTCSWSFGDNTFSNLCDPKKVYNQNGTFRIRLTVTVNGCTDTISKLVNVSTPITGVDFTGTPRQKCVPPLTVNFTGTAPGATSVQYDWGHNNNTCPTLNCSYTYTQFGCYDVTLSATNAQGCVAKVTKRNYICIQSFDAVINVDSTSGCAPLTLRFSNGTQVGSPIVACQWSMGNNLIHSTDCNTPFNYTFQNPGTYKVWLRVQTADGCFDTAFTTINVTPRPIADFTATPLQACLKVPIIFTCLCSGGTTYQWDFGPGSSTQQNPIHLYDQTGPHTVTLTVRNGRCATTVTKVDYITSLVPRADFNFRTSCVNPLKVDFTSTSEGADSLWWRFHTGYPTTPKDTATNISYTYLTQGVYQVTLYVYNIQTGCIDSITKPVNISNQSINFGVSKRNACVGEALTFSDSTSFASTWIWYFGDGDTSHRRNPVKRYNTPGRYSVKLVVNKGLVCSDSLMRVNYITIHKPNASYNYNPTNGCAPLTVNFSSTSTGNTAPIIAWNWRFTMAGIGNNVNSTTGDTTWTFPPGAGSAFNVRLIVTDTVGCKDTVTQMVRQTVVIPNFTLPTNTCAGKADTFRNTTSSPVSFTYVWDFGDGDTLSLPTNAPVSHTYAQSDTYYVKLTAISKSDGCVGQIVKMHIVNSIGLDFSSNAVTSFCPPFATQFINTTPDKTGVTFKWYFGDGRSQETDGNPFNVYQFPGDYDVTLVGIKGQCRDSLVKPKYIRILGPRLENVQFSPPYGCRPLTVFFSGKIYESQSAVIQWRVGDVQNIPIVYGDTVYFNGAHVYSDPQFDTGYIKPVLLLEDNKGCKVAYPLGDSVYVDEYPHPNQRDTSVCIGAVVQYQLPDGDFFKWEPSDYLDCDTCKFVVANAPDTITYIITATTIWGCEAKDTITLNVEDLPRLDVKPDGFFRLCTGESTVLCAGDVYNALWSPPLYISSPTAICPTVYAVDTITWIVYSENRLGNRPGCFVYDTVTLYPIDTVKVDFIQDTSVCSGESIKLNINVQEASNNDTAFFWYPAAYLDNPNLEDPVATPPYSMHFTVIIKSPLCVPDTHTFFVRVDPLPDIELYRDTIVAVGTDLELSALSADATTYNWQSVDPLTCSDCATPVLTANYSQWVKVTVTNEFDCKSTDSAFVKVLPCQPDFVFVPTVFTPNGDGLNDKLFVRGKALKKLNTFIVSNRWGNIVFSTNNIKEGWDGTFRGQLCPTDAYVWYVRGICTNDQEVEKKGTITLVR